MWQGHLHQFANERDVLVSSNNLQKAIIEAHVVSIECLFVLIKGSHLIPSKSGILSYFQKVVISINS